MRRKMRHSAPRKGELRTKEPAEEGIRTLRFISMGDMDFSRRVLAALPQPGLDDYNISDDSVQLIGSMKDELQAWNAIVIVAHVKTLSGEKGIGSGLEMDLAGAIRGLCKENISEGMAKRLRIIAECSPNDLARAEARRKLGE